MAKKDHVTICDLEQAIARLKLAEFFSFDQAELNEGWGHCDVFPDVEDLEALEPTDEGDAHGFLAWSREAADGAFDEAGVLRRALPMCWGGSRASLQMAFAESGLTVRIECDEEGHEVFGESGRILLSPRSATTDCDLLAVLRAFEVLRGRGIVALANAGFTESDGWTAVAEDARGAEVPASVFWTEQKHDAFDDVGNLASTLLLHWQGDAEAILAGLREVGFTVAPAPPESRCIEVLVGPSGAVDLEHIPRAAHGRTPGRSAAAAERVLQPEAGPLRRAGAFRCSDPQPVERLALDPQRPTRVALAQGLDVHSFPTRPGCIVDLATESLEAPLTIEGRAMGVGGLHLLHDGRVLFCTTELRKLGPEDEFGTSCLVLHGPEGEILVQSFANISDTSLLTFDDAERFAALGQPDGALVYELPGPGGPWPEPQRLRVPHETVEAAYTRTAISPDARSVAWCDDWSHPLACFDRETGRLRWQHAPRNQRRWRLRFTPDSSAIGIMAGGDAKSRHLQLWAADSGVASEPALDDLTRGLKCFDFHRDGRVVAIGEARGRVTFVDRLEGKRLATVAVLAAGDVTALAFDAAGEHLAVGGSKGDVALFRYTGDFDEAGAFEAEPSAPRPLFAGRNKGHPLIGARGRLVGSLHAGETATVQAISVDGSRLRVVVDFLGRTMEVAVSPLEFWDPSRPLPVSASSPYRIGDQVFAHAGSPRGSVLAVEGVDEANRRVFASDDDGDLAAPVFDDITLVSPLRRDPLDDYLAVLERRRFGIEAGHRLTMHCVELLRAADWNLEHADLGADSAAAAGYAALEEQLWDQMRREREGCLERLHARFGPLDREARVALWQEEWKTWTGDGELRRIVADMPPEFYDEDKRTAMWTLRERFERKDWSSGAG